MNKTLFAKELRANLFVFAALFAMLVMYIACIVMMFDPQLGESLNTMMASMPELFAAFGMASQATTLLDFQLNYLYGFLFTLIPFVLILVMVNKLMVRYLDRGTMAYLLATPNSRTRIALTLAAVLIAALLALAMLVTTVQIACSHALFPNQLDLEGLLRANAGLVGLWLFLAGMCFLSACAFSNASAALWAGGGAGIAFFLMQMVSQVGDKFEFLRNVNPLTLFDPYGLAAGESLALGQAAVLGIAGIVLFAAAVAVFDRRDLSI